MVNEKNFHSDLSSFNNQDENQTETQARTEGKYGLRPRTRIKRLQQQESTILKESVKKVPRTKSRPAPLSKYRRKTANARERHRMREINNAFESLRKALPGAFEPMTSNAMTKITTLRLAVQYIQALSKVLEDEDDLRDAAPFFSADSPHKLKSDGDLELSSQPEANQGCFRYQVAKDNHSYIPTMVPLSLQLSVQGSPPNRGSLSSSSDLDDLLSDDSVLLDDNTDVFHDISALPGPDPFELLLGQERENFMFTQTDFRV